MAGYGSLGANFAYKNSTDMLYHQAEDILPLVPNTPVLAGITAGGALPRPRHRDPGHAAKGL